MKDIKEFKNKYGLSGLHSQPTGYMNFEDKTEEVFKDVELLINKTREETIMEERKRIYCYVEEMLIGSDNELLKNLSNIIFDKIN